MWFLHPPFRRPSRPVDPAEVMASFRGAPGAYLHVPFCRTTCPFCPYNKVRYDSSAVRTYFSALRREVAAYGTPPGGPFASLYVGGGTPTLCLDELEEVVADLPVAGERAIEVLPAHATTETLGRLATLGFTHVSLGVQSFDRGVLRHLGRPGRVADHHAALARARGRFDCVDVDLIFDTAFGDADTFLRDVETCFRGGADQVSTYPLMRFGMTPFGKAPHAPAAEHEALRRATDLAARHGYERRAVWTFHRRGAPTYSSITRDTYLGLGAGAATWTGGSFLANHFSPAAYAEDLAAGRLPVARRLDLGRLAAGAYALFWRLYTGSVSSVDPGVPRVLTTLIALASFTGHLHRRGARWHLTRRGYDAYHDVERWVTYRYIEPLWTTLTRER